MGGNKYNDGWNRIFGQKRYFARLLEYFEYEYVKEGIQEKSGWEEVRRLEFKSLQEAENFVNKQPDPGFDKYWTATEECI